MSEDLQDSYEEQLPIDFPYLESEPGINSFVSGIEFTDYLSTRLNASNLVSPFAINSNDETRASMSRALILATKLIDQFEFVGKVADANQPLQWPRINAVNRNGQLIASNIIPGGIKDAVCELAYFLLQHDITDPLQARYVFNLTSERTGEAQQNYKTYGGKMPDYILSLLKPYLIEQSQYSSRLIP